MSVLQLFQWIYAFRLFLTIHGDVARIYPPLVYNAYLNQTKEGMFTCVVTGGASARWMIDGQPADSDAILNRGIMVSYDVTQLPGYILATVSIPATAENSGGVFCKCRRYITHLQYIESDETAQFNVQGLLQLSSNITVTNFNRSHLSILWQEPFTYNISGDSIEPDIYGYTVCISTLLEYTCTSTSSPDIILPKYCFDISVIINAQNIVGQSNNVAYKVKATNSSNFIDVEEPSVDVSFHSNQTGISVKFHVQEQVLGICLHLYHVNIIHLDTNSTVLRTSLYGYQDIVLYHYLQTDSMYLATVNSSSGSITGAYLFTTYDVQNVSYSNDQENLTVICQFAKGSRAKGFKIDILSHKQLIRTKYITLHNNCTCCQKCSQDVNFPISELARYRNITITVYDWERNGEVIRAYSNNILIVLRDTVIITTGLSHTTTLTSAAITTKHQLQVQWGAIGGGVVGTLFLTTSAFILLTLLIVKIKCRLLKTETEHEDECQPNIAYSVVLRTESNEAYSISPTANTQPHIYEEINDHHQTSSAEPVYSQI